MNFVYVVVAFVGIASSVDAKCDVVEECLKYLIDLIDGYAKFPQPSVVQPIPDTLKKILSPVPQLNKKGLKDCVSRFFLPSKKLNYCYVRYVSAYSEKHSCKYPIEIYGDSSIKYRNGKDLLIWEPLLRPFWNDKVLIAIANELFGEEIDMEEELCPKLQRFNRQEKANRTKMDYARAFNESVQFLLFSYSSAQNIGINYCVRLLWIAIADYFGVPAAQDRDGYWID